MQGVTQKLQTLVCLSLNAYWNSYLPNPVLVIVETISKEKNIYSPNTHTHTHTHTHTYK
jgi:hypothetical protein